jgi:hypothetical protein
MNRKFSVICSFFFSTKYLFWIFVIISLIIIKRHLLLDLNSELGACHYLFAFLSFVEKFDWYKLPQNVWTAGAKKKKMCKLMKMDMSVHEYDMACCACHKALLQADTFMTGRGAGDGKDLSLLDTRSVLARKVPSRAVGVWHKCIDRCCC